MTTRTYDEEQLETIKNLTMAEAYTGEVASFACTAQNRLANARMTAEEKETRATIEELEDKLLEIMLEADRLGVEIEKLRRGVEA